MMVCEKAETRLGILSDGKEYRNMFDYKWTTYKHESMDNLVSGEQYQYI